MKAKAAQIIAQANKDRLRAAAEARAAQRRAEIRKLQTQSMARNAKECSGGALKYKPFAHLFERMMGAHR